MEGLLFRSLEGLPVTSSYQSPDLEVNQNQKNLSQMIFKGHVLYLRKKKVLLEEKCIYATFYVLHQCICVSSQKKSNPLFISIHMGKAILISHNKCFWIVSVLVMLAIFSLNILPFKKTLRRNDFQIISQSSDCKKPVKGHCSASVQPVFLTKYKCAGEHCTVCQ